MQKQIAQFIYRAKEAGKALSGNSRDVTAQAGMWGMAAQDLFGSKVGCEVYNAFLNGWNAPRS